MNGAEFKSTSLKLPAKWAPIVTPFILSCFMTCIVSLISTVRTIGWRDDLLTLWMGAWGVSWLVAFPALLLVLPLTRKVTSWIVEPPP